MHGNCKHGKEGTLMDSPLNIWMIQICIVLYLLCRAPGSIVSIAEVFVQHILKKALLSLRGSNGARRGQLVGFHQEK
jgi:hypothetical protein